MRSLHHFFTNIKLYEDFKKIGIVVQLNVSTLLESPYIVKYTPYFYGIHVIHYKSQTGNHAVSSVRKEFKFLCIYLLSTRDSASVGILFD